MQDSIDAKNDIETLLYQFLDSELKLEPSYFYYRNEVSKKNVIYSYSSTSLNEIPLTERIIIRGLPILQLHKDKIFIFPRLIELIITDIRHRTVTRDMVTSLVYDSELPPTSQLGLVLVKDDRQNIVGLGHVKRDEYKSLVDIGWYLRSEDDMKLS